MVEFQRYFIKALLTKVIEPNIFVSCPDLDARIETYRRNFMQGYSKALKKTFSITAQYLGDIFEELSVSYICKNRPAAGQLFVTYGQTFPQHLSDPIAQELARLEWELQTILIGPIDAQPTSSFPEDSEEVYWQLRGGVTLFQSEYPVSQLYVGLTQGKGMNGLLSISSSYYLLCRADENPVIVPLNEYEYLALTHLTTPHRIGELFDKLTFSKEIFVSILEKIFNVNFLKVAYVDNSFNSKMYSNL